MKASEVINPAIKRAYAHLGPEPIPKGSLLATLASYDEDIYRLVLREAPHVLEETSTKISVTSSKNQNGYRLKDAIGYTRFRLLDSDGNVTPIRVVTTERSANPPSHPSGVVRPGPGSSYKFYPSDPLTQRWEGSDDRGIFDPDEHRLEYTYIPAYEAPEDLNDELGSPRFAKMYLEQVLVNQILQMQGVGRQREANKEGALYSDIWQHLDRFAPVESTVGDDRKQMIWLEDPTS